MTAPESFGLIAELEQATKDARQEADDAILAPEPLQVVAFFDLSGSTLAKSAHGNRAGSKDAYAFTALAASVADHFHGRLVKNLGDGVLVTFEDPVRACWAALNVRHATYEHLRLEMKGGLTVGRPLGVSLKEGGPDLLGDVIDRAARIESLALPGQILIDSTLHGLVRNDLIAYRDIHVDDEPRRAYAKGIGDLELFEIALSPHWPLKKQLATPFVVLTNGRPSLSEKRALIRNAQHEIIEIGIGLTSFAQYFKGQRPEELREPLQELARQGVDIRCFALDLDYPPGLAWLDEQGDDDYGQQATFARKHIEAEGRRYRNEGFPGTLQYFTYRRIPDFWCLGVDVDDPLYGRMFFASYLMGVERAAMPVVQVSRISNPELYAKYLSAIKELREASNEPPRR